MAAGQAEWATSTTASCVNDHAAAEAPLTSITSDDQGLLGGCLPADPGSGVAIDESGFSNGEISTSAACLAPRSGPLSEPIMIRVRFEGRYTGTSVNSRFVVEEPLGRDQPQSGRTASRSGRGAEARLPHRALTTSPLGGALQLFNIDPAHLQHRLHRAAAQSASGSPSSAISRRPSPAQSPRCRSSSSSSSLPSPASRRHGRDRSSRRAGRGA